MDDPDMDLGQLRQRQVGALSRALGHFVTLKSTNDGWQPVESTLELPDSDIDVHVSKRPLRVGDSKNTTIDIYRLTASIPLDGETTRDTQGSFSAYLSELRDWQAILECPGIRSRWNYFLQQSSCVEMLDAHTSITHSVLRKPVAGCTKEFAHARDLLMVETSLVDPTTAIYVATSLPTTANDPSYLRQKPNTKRVRSDLWAWCVEIATPMAVTPEMMLRKQTLGRRKPAVCVQVTCFLHLELGSWRSYDHDACRAAANLIPALVAYLRLHGAPPRLARVGPAVTVDRRDWLRMAERNDRPIWEVSCSLADASMHASTEQPIVARILAMQAAGNEHALSSYLSSSLQRKQTESVALGTHGGGIVRDGEAVAVAATRAWMGNAIVEFVVDASRWAQEGCSVEITAMVDGLAGARLRDSVMRAQMAAPELFTESQKTQLDDQVLGEDELAALLVRCYAIASVKSSRRRYLVRVVMPPPVLDVNDDIASESESGRMSIAGELATEQERAKGMRVTVHRGDAEGSMTQAVVVNGKRAEVVRFSLDPADHQPPRMQPRPMRLFAKSANTSPRSVSRTLDRQRPASIAAGCARPKQPQKQMDNSEHEGDTTPTVLDTEGEPLDEPLARLRAVQQLDTDGWTQLGSESAGVRVARADASIGKLDDSYVVRVEAALEGWTVFDVLGAIQQTPRTGLWDAVSTVRHESPAAATVRCENKGTWTTQARSTMVCRVWTTDGRRRIDMAECSVPNAKDDATVQADVGLAAWVLETTAGDSVDGRARSASVATMLTDLAADVEAANQRRRQHVVRLTRYLQYNPGGWLDSTDKSVGQPLRKLAAAQLSKDAALADLTLVRDALEKAGAVPGVVWARNVHMVETQYLDAHSGLALTYRLASAERHGAAIEIRIEHRVWARPDGGAATVSVDVEPWSSGCAIACFVDPDADPHATRVRIRHPRDQLLPQVDVLGTAWPTICVRVTRSATETNTASIGGERPAWSVPPRVLVNNVAARVRYLRRTDADDTALYTRCVSVAARDVPRLLRVSESTVIDDAPSVRDSASDATPTDDMSALRRNSSALADVAVLGYSAPDVATDARTTLVSAERLADLATRVFADARHDVSTDDARRRWHTLRGRPGHQWEHRQTDIVSVYERQADDIHRDVPLVMAVAVLQRTEIAQVMQAILQPWHGFDQAVISSRRTLESVASGTTIEHVHLQTPLLCDRRDALTVRRVEMAPFMPARQRLQTWQKGEGACGRRGDYRKPTLTVVEASVPMSQPLRSATRALIPLFAVRVEPIDGFERIASGSAALQQPACRLFVASCVDLAGSMPMAIRRAWSVRISELVVTRIRHLLATPLGPRLLAPLSASRVVGDRCYAKSEQISAIVDGRVRRFSRELDRHLASELSRDGKYSVSVRLPQWPRAHDESGNETLPVVADILVPATCFPTGCSIGVGLASATLPPPEGARVPCGQWISRDRRLTVFVLEDADSADGSGALLVRVALASSADEDEDEDEEEEEECCVTMQPVVDGSAASGSAVLVNGQPMRVHRQQPFSTPLVSVGTSDGRRLEVCAQCGSVSCADDPTDADYLSDHLSADETGAAPPPRTPTERSSAATPLLPDALSLRSVDSAQSQPTMMLRQRRQQQQQQNPTDDSLVSDKNDGYVVSQPIARALRMALGLAVFLPVRRLVVGCYSVQRYLDMASDAKVCSAPATMVRKSTLCLVLLLLIAVASVALGIKLALVVYA
ncbi:hypothetical protein H4R99_004506 [Coemansia sp. RSA 1722]|nr:hypothetical protein IWW45_004760 [Coemansia sp. RSA 485]KAJ2597431.1 hypothetical protein H4R99_004506 [Coemansia sp. RSA 1722]KAJ2637964.1 hypothetical protein GGF40_001987 [Coemansia sp. RSA 1286]